MTLRICTNFVLISSFLVCSMSGSTQSNSWSKMSDESFSNIPYERKIVPSKHLTFELNLVTLIKQLKKSPKRFSDEARNEATLPIAQMPDADGEMQSYQFVKSSVMHPKLDAKYPEINTYIGYNIDKPGVIIHCGVSHKGFHGMIKSPGESTQYIDVYASGMTDKYIVYSRKDYQRNDQFTCQLKAEVSKNTNHESSASSKLVGDCQLRIFDLALACTGEYAQFHGGTVEDVMAEFVISMTRVNGIYETDANLTMVLIENNDELIFLNATSDPYTNDIGGEMLGENQSTIDDIIGFDNYHIGHVFSTGGGGIASLRSPCTDRKARGVTGQLNPTGDPFWVDYVAHEMGHQYGGNHTQNNDCNRAGNAAVEPGSASTIMGYAGICFPNVQNNSDDHFHAYNLAEIASFLNGNGGTCPSLSPNGNIAPEITVAANSYVVPISTSLRLTASATDADEDNVLSYCWEQMNSTPAPMPPVPTNTAGPAFRSISPTPSPTRYLPNINAVIAGATPEWEVIPSVSREMDWRCTIRDNNIGGGCTTEADVALTFTDSAGPFLVEAPNTSDVIWRVGGIETVEWDVANTDAAPVNSSMVDILLSSDGGLTYPDVLATQVPNTGSSNITVPFVFTDQARVMVIGSDNIFFDISNENFIITDPTFRLIINNNIEVACLGEDVNYEISLISFLDYDEEVTFSTQGAPEGIELQFASVTSPSVGSNVLTILGASNLDAGTYLFDIIGESVDTLMSMPVQLIILEQLQPTTLNTPPNGSTQLPTNGVALEWNILGGEEEFLVELSTDPGFSNTVTIANTPESILDLDALSGSTVYYWRVKGINQCEEGEFGPTYAFQTSIMDICERYSSSDNFPIAIPPDITSQLEISNADVGNYVKVNLDILHEYVGDISATLIAPDGDEIILFDQPGIENSQYGCNNADMLVSLYDGAENTAEDLADTCEDVSPTISGDYQPLNSLAAFSTSDVNGTWILDIDDAFVQADDGSLQSWSIDICRAIEPGVVSVEKEILLVAQGLSEIISQEILETSGESELVTYTILTLPVKGTLQINNLDAAIGNTFTQSDVNNGLITYIHSGIDAEGDSFTFDIVDGNSNWLPGQVQEIAILPNDLSATAAVTGEILCQGDTTGEITVSADGGSEPYTYLLNDVEQNGPIISGLIAGTYEIVVVDNFNYEVIVSDIVIDDKEELTLDFNVLDNSITVLVEGGTPPYLISINGGDLQPNTTYSSLGNGTYDILVRDDNGCESEGQVTIDIDGVQAEIYLTNSLFCFGDSDASVTLEAVDGFPPYEYRIVGQPWQDSNFFEGLSAGNYTFRVRDNENNVINFPLVIEQPEELSVNVDVATNSFTINTSGGTGELMYILNGGIIYNTEVTDLADGEYTLIVIDENECEVTQLITITIDDLVLDGSLLNGVECFGDKNASVMLTASGGVAPYSYRLGTNPYQDSPLFSDLRAGTYAFRVRDAQGKTTNLELTITEPDLITGDLVIVYNTITVIASGGTGNLTYQLNEGPPQSDNTFTNVANGVYPIRVTDELGCSVTIEGVVDVAVLVGMVSDSSPPTCINDTDGSLTLTATDGIPPFNYSIDGINFQDSPTFTGLGAGVYQPTLRDDLGQVTQLDVVTFVNPEPVAATVIPFGPTITLVGSGGTAPYTYSLDGGAFSAQTEYPDLPNGEYDIRVRDNNGCEGGLESEGLYLHNSFQGFTTSTIPISCAGEADGSIINFSFVGGIAPYTIFVNGIEYSMQSLLNNLAANTYEVTVQDATGYSAGTQTVVFVDPEVLTLDFNVSSGSIDLIGAGGTGDLQYSLDNGQTFQDSPTFTGLMNADYIAVVMDANGCTTEVMITLSDLDDIKNDFDFVVSPNPSTGQITLQLKSDYSKQMRVSVINALGQIVSDSTIEDQSSLQTLNLNYLPSGQYQISVTDGDKLAIKKIVIQH